MDEGITWLPHHELYLPSMFQILDFTHDTIVFMGRFRLEEEALPVEGILVHKDTWVHARITTKEILEDSDEEDEDPHKGAFYDEEMGGYIRLFPPDECIQITYTTLKELHTKEEVDSCMEHVETLGKQVWQRSQELRQAREERELQEHVAEQNRLYAERKAKEAAAAEEGEFIPVSNKKKSEAERDSSTDSETDDGYDTEHSFHCGCEYDPYPDDPFCGTTPPDFDYHAEPDLRKAEGEARHVKKAVYKGNKYHKKPVVFKQECQEHAHHKQRILRNTIHAQTKGGADTP
jgi:hypothetical protein